MADGQKLSDSQLKKLEEDLGLKFDSVKKQLSAIQATIDQLESSRAWVGLGGRAFDKKQREINNEMVGMGNKLVFFQEAIAATRKLSAGNEDQIAAAMRGVDVVDGHTGSAEGARTADLSQYSDVPASKLNGL